MARADTSYVRERDGAPYIGATQVTAHSLIAAWRNEGYSAQELQDSFPALTLAQVYGSIAYYLEHRQALDALRGGGTRVLPAGETGPRGRS